MAECKCKKHEKKEAIKEKLSKIDKKQLKMGVEVEKEHGPKGPGRCLTDVTHGDAGKTKKIAQAHLLEKKDYYSKLKKVEKKKGK